jgi:membrane glycosyltransferase
MKKLLLFIALMPTLAFADNPTPSPTPSAVDQALVEMIHKSTSTVGEAKDFVVSQAPDVVKQILTWQSMKYYILSWFSGVILAISLLTVVICLLVMLISGDPDVSPFIAFIFAIVMLVSSMMFYTGLTGYLQIKYTPKAYLVEYAQGLAGK